MKRVVANKCYEYDPVLMDRIHRPYGVTGGLFDAGDIVRVVNLPGCPRCNTMGMCHIQHPETTEFLGLVCVGSLGPISKKS